MCSNFYHKRSSKSGVMRPVGDIFSKYAQVIFFTLLCIFSIDAGPSKRWFWYSMLFSRFFLCSESLAAHSGDIFCRGSNGSKRIAFEPLQVIFSDSAREKDARPWKFGLADATNGVRSNKPGEPGPIELQREIGLNGLKGDNIGRRALDESLTC